MSKIIKWLRCFAFCSKLISTLATVELWWRWVWPLGRSGVIFQIHNLLGAAACPLSTSLAQCWLFVGLNPGQFNSSAAVSQSSGFLPLLHIFSLHQVERMLRVWRAHTLQEGGSLVMWAHCSLPLILRCSSQWLSCNPAIRVPCFRLWSWEGRVVVCQLLVSSLAYLKMTRMT